MLASEVYVNDNWFEVANGGGSPGILDSGDTVDNRNDPGAPIQTGTFAETAFATIQDGIDAVEPGGTVHVLAGQFNETVSVTKNVELRGAQADVDPELRDWINDIQAETSVIASGASATAFQVNAGLSDVTINGFNITGLTTGGSGVAGDGHIGLSVTHNFIHDFVGHGVSLGSGTSAGLVRFNEVFHTSHGVYLSRGASNHTIADNFIHDSGSNEGDITLEGDNTDVTIRNNTLQSAGPAGILVGNSGSDFTGTQAFLNAIVGVVGIKNSSEATFDAERNWWGVDDMALIDAKSIGEVDFSPWWADGFDQASNVSGFQPFVSGGKTTISVVNGQLIIQGDDSDGHVSVTGVGSGTGVYRLVTDQGAQIVSGVTADIFIDLGGGGHHVQMDNVYVNGAIDIRTSESGGALVMLGHKEPVSTRTEMRINLGKFRDEVNGRQLYIGTHQFINLGDGDDDLILHGVLFPKFTLGTSSAGNSTWITGNGNDRVFVNFAYIVGNLSIDLGAGDDLSAVQGSAVSGSMFVFGGAGIDDLRMYWNFLVTDFLLDGGADDDGIYVVHGLGPKVLTIRAGTGSDKLTVENQAAEQFHVDMGAGADIVDVRASAFDRFFVSLGDDDDRLTIFGNLSRLETDLDGGPGGTDLLHNFGNDFRGFWQTRGFELF